VILAVPYSIKKIYEDSINFDFNMQMRTIKVITTTFACMISLTDNGHARSNSLPERYAISRIIQQMAIFLE
jgi:hypothetical protein